MNLPSHCVADTIAKFIIVAMKRPGGETSGWIRLPPPARTLWLETHPLPVANTETRLPIATTGLAKVPKDV
jgi:hypothetical protein